MCILVLTVCAGVTDINHRYQSRAIYDTLFALCANSDLCHRSTEISKIGNIRLSCEVVSSEFSEK